MRDERSRPRSFRLSSLLRSGRLISDSKRADYALLLIGIPGLLGSAFAWLYVGIAQSLCENSCKTDIEIKWLLMPAIAILAGAGLRSRRELRSAGAALMILGTVATLASWLLIVLRS